MKGLDGGIWRSGDGFVMMTLWVLRFEGEVVGGEERGRGEGKGRWGGLWAGGDCGCRVGGMVWIGMWVVLRPKGERRRGQRVGFCLAG